MKNYRASSLPSIKNNKFAIIKWAKWFIFEIWIFMDTINFSAIWMSLLSENLFKDLNLNLIISRKWYTYWTFD